MDLKLVCLLSIIGMVLAAPLDDDKAVINKYEFVPNSGDGYYKISYETSNGLERQEEGTPGLGKDNTQVIRVKGYYSYFSDNGKVLVNYEADENGYRENIGDYVIVEPHSVGIPAAAIGSLIGGGLG